jgi:MFS transporter, NNP family, nitrate/nitrite transporter
MLKGLLSFTGSYRILHLTWFAFFLTFMCWFNFAPFASVIGKELHLDPGQIKTIAICNLALTIPARIIIGALLDRFGPRITYSVLMIFAIVPCTATVLATDFSQMVIARLLMGIVGSGFVLGIRMVSEWFPPKDIGMAQGIYGGWGNFGAFGSEFILPIIATSAAVAGGASNWRAAIMTTGVITAVYGVIYFMSVTDTPPGKEYKRPSAYGGLEVTSAGDFYGLLAMNFGLICALGVLAWRLAQIKIGLAKQPFLNDFQMYGIWFLLLCLYAYQSYQAWLTNRDVVLGRKTFPPSERYEFTQVALLQFGYVVSFGSELAAVSMLPTFFEKTFPNLSHTEAAMIAACYPFFNLVSRPSGGYISDKLGSRKWTMTGIMLGIGMGYLAAYGINKEWALPMAIGATMLSALFAQAGCGTTYGMAPLIKKSVTGQIAGNIGAYGNFGGVVYLTIFSLTDAKTLFATMAIGALICAAMCAFFLKEPKNSFGEDTLSSDLEGVSSSYTGNN